MNIGDKVRSLFGSEEGVVVRFIDEKHIEVEIEDGFRIPFAKHELVVVAAAETEIFGDEIEEKKALNKVAEKNKQTAVAEKGVYLAFTHRNDQLLDVKLVNNTDLELLYVFGEEENRNFKGVASGTLMKRNYLKISEMNLDKFERWPNLIFQLLFFKLGNYPMKEPLVKKMRFKAAGFHKSRREAPIIGEEAYLFQLDSEMKELNPQQVIERIANNSAASSQTKDIEKQAAIRKQAKQEIDLHAEALLGKDFRRIDKAEILNHQLKAFEIALDQGIFAGLDELVFIHGVGNGVLKNEIQKRLSKNPDVKFYKDARKEKFGYGATLVALK